MRHGSRSAAAGRWRCALLGSAAWALCAACAPDVDFEITRPRRSADGGATAPLPFASAGGGLALLTWNLEWFQDPGRGPSDDARQFAVAREVLVDSGFDLLGLQEIAVPERLEALVAASPDHAVVTSSYEWPQQTALVYRSSRLSLARAQEIAGLDDAGRPPLEVELVSERGERWVVIVVHAKAGAERSSRAVRERFAAGLLRHLDARPAGTHAVVLGDFNDRFGGSIAEGELSPYALFARGSGYTAVTAPLERGPEASTAWGQTLDHVLLSDELAARVEPGSVDVLRDELLAREPEFWDRVSDHAPVTLRLRAR